MQSRWIALRSDRICAHSDCAWIAIRVASRGPDPGGGSSAILEVPRNPRNWVLWLFATQSCGLWSDCKYNAILPNWTGARYQPKTLAMPARSFAILAQTRGLRIERKCKDCNQNIGTAILTAIFTIQSNCDEIGKPQRIAMGWKGLHQNHGKSTNCKKTSPIAPESASFRNRSGIMVQSTQNRGDAGTIL